MKKICLVLGALIVVLGLWLCPPWNMSDRLMFFWVVLTPMPVLAVLAYSGAHVVPALKGAIVGGICGGVVGRICAQIWYRTCCEPVAPGDVSIRVDLVFGMVFLGCVFASVGAGIGGHLSERRNKHRTTTDANNRLETAFSETRGK